jgi:thiamine biosynthesis lipoprotein
MTAMTNRFCRLALLPGFLLVFLFFGCSKTKIPPSRSEYVLGTLCGVRIHENGRNDVYQAVFERLRKIDSIFNNYSDKSALSEINQKAGIEPVSVPVEIITVLNRALLFAELSDGLYDPTIGPLVQLWGIGSAAARVPPPEEIEEALALVNWRDVEVDTENNTVFLKRPGMLLDLGGIVKGYAADETLRIIREAGVRGALIDLGGNLIAYGEKVTKYLSGKARPWKIGVQHPRLARGSFIGTIEVYDSTLVTSGKYERFFEAGGKRYHHILSAKTGYPVEHSLDSITIVQSLFLQDGSLYATASMDADALSTTVFILGYENGSSFISQFSNAEAIFVLNDGNIRTTQALRGRFIQTTN